MQVREPTGEHPDQIQTGSFAPMPVFGSGFAYGYRPVAFQTPEMVDAHHIKQRFHPGNPANPPAVAVLLHGVPTVKGIAPKLPVFAEIIRRYARHGGGAKIFVQLEIARVGPHIGGIHGYVNGQVANQTDAFAAGIIPHTRPLAEEGILQKHVELHFGEMFPGKALQCRRLTVPEFFRPFRPACTGEMLLQRHESGIIREPRGAALKIFQYIPVSLPSGSRGFFQQRSAQRMNTVVVHRVLGGAPIQPHEVLAVQQSVFRQSVQINEIRVAGIGRIALIRGIAESGRTNGQHLPPRNTGIVEKINECFGGISQGADAVRGGQGENREQNTAAPGEVSHKDTSSQLYSL